MTTVVDLGWALARVTMTADPEACELVIIELPDEGNEASGIVHITSRPFILALQNAIWEEEQACQTGIELSKQDIPQ